MLRIVMPVRKDPNPENPYFAVGVRLIAAREAVELRAVDFCAAIGVQKNTLSQWESGIHPPARDAIERFAERYGVTMDWIYLGRVGGLPANLLEAIQRQPILRWLRHPPSTERPA